MSESFPAIVDQDKKMVSAKATIDHAGRVFPRNTDRSHWSESSRNLEVTTLYMIPYNVPLYKCILLSFLLRSRSKIDHSLLWEDERPWERGCTASWLFVRQYQFIATRKTHCFCIPNMETTVPFGRAISVRQLPFAVLSDNVF